MKIKNYKKISLILVIGFVFFSIVGISCFKFLQKYNIGGESISQNKVEDKKEPEKVVSYIGTNEEGKKYTYDAKKVESMLNNYDYSNNGVKVVFLTFDDGTSKTNTPNVLKILDENHIKATFFLTGSNIENGGQEAKELVKREFNGGHAIGNHSYSHDIHQLYPSRYLDIQAFKADFEKNDKLLKNILGYNFSTRVIRCPGGYMSWKGMNTLDKYLQENNLVSIDWNALSGDAQGGKKTANQLINYAIETSKNKNMVVILMHDTYGKEETVKSLPEIIKYFKDNGYEFKTLS